LGENSVRAAGFNSAGVSLQSGDPMHPTHDARHTRPARFEVFPMPLALVAAVLIGLGQPGAALGQTYTGVGNGNFSNIQNWSFGGGPIPVSGSGTTLNFQSYGTAGYTASNDLQMTLGTLQLSTFATGSLTLASALAGDYSFTGAGQIQILGS